MKTLNALAHLTFVGMLAGMVATAAAQAPKTSIAHRGASGYAPEHTMAAYQLAIDQKVDFVEQDLAVTKDGVLICLHDDSLERTSNVEDVFPDRFVVAEARGGAATARGDATGARGGAGTASPRKRWLANDFTLAEIRQLDFGSWYDKKFAGARIVTFEEAIALVRAHPGTGMYPELKSPPLYTSRGVDMLKMFADMVRKNGLDTPASLATTPMILQSFDEGTIKRAATELPTIPRVFLTSSNDDVTAPRLKQIAAFATGIGPEKAVIARDPSLVARAHDAGLTVTSWTFAASANSDVRQEMSKFLYTFGIDALFTNNPDLFPKRP